MEIIGIGTSIVEVVRVAKHLADHGDVFLRRVYTEREIQRGISRKRPAEWFAGRWAAKEAMLQALGTTWKKGGVAATDVEIAERSHGVLEVRVRGRAKLLVLARRTCDVKIAVATNRYFATATVLVLAKAKRSSSRSRSGSSGSRPSIPPPPPFPPTLKGDENFSVQDDGVPPGDLSS